MAVMKIMKTFKMSHGGTAAFSAPNLATSHSPLMPLSVTPGHSWEVWVSLLVESQTYGGLTPCGVTTLFPVSWCAQVLFVSSKSLFLQSCVSSVGSVGGYWQSPLRGLMPYPGLLDPEPLSLQQATADPYLQRRNSVTVLAQGCGLGMCFVPFLGQSSLGNQVLGKCTVPVGLHLNHLLSLLLDFPGAL